MTYEGSVKFSYSCNNTGHFKYDSTFPELLPNENVTIESSLYDLNIHQYFQMFRKFLGAVGFNEQVILDGAFQFAFNDINNKEIVDKLMEDYEIEDKKDPYLSYTETEAIREFINGRESAYKEIKDNRIRETLIIVTENVHSIRDQQWKNRNSTDDEKESIYNQESNASWGGLVPGSPEAVENKCLCPRIDNEEMPDNLKWVSSDCPIHGKIV